MQEGVVRDSSPGATVVEDHRRSAGSVACQDRLRLSGLHRPGSRDSAVRGIHTVNGAVGIPVIDGYVFHTIVVDACRIGRPQSNRVGIDTHLPAYDGASAVGGEVKQRVDDTEAGGTNGICTIADRPRGGGHDTPERSRQWTRQRNRHRHEIRRGVARGPEELVKCVTGIRVDGAGRPNGQDQNRKRQHQLR